MNDATPIPFDLPVILSFLDIAKKHGFTCNVITMGTEPERVKDNETAAAKLSAVVVARVWFTDKDGQACSVRMDRAKPSEESKSGEQEHYEPEVWFCDPLGPLPYSPFESETERNPELSAALADFNNAWRGVARPEIQPVNYFNHSPKFLVSVARRIIETLPRRREKANVKTYQTDTPCSCRPGAQRDNCTACEGTGFLIDFHAIHRDRHTEKQSKAAQDVALCSRTIDDLVDLQDRGHGDASIATALDSINSLRSRLEEIATTEKQRPLSVAQIESFNAASQRGEATR